jgi:putative chitinase
MQFKFNHDVFIGNFRPYFERFAPLTPGRVASLNGLLSQIEQDNVWRCIEHIAYALATVMHETAYTFAPIDERGGFAYFERRYGWHTAVGKRLGNDAPGEGAKYHGRGDVQLTGETNYERLELDLRKNYAGLIADFEARTGQTFDLSEYPNQAKDAAIAYAIMAFGMYNGRFTGKSFGSFEVGAYASYRRIINGQDKAGVIAKHAMAFANSLSAAMVTEAPVALAELPPAQSLSTPVALEKIEPHTTDAKTAFEAIQSYGKGAAKALGITSAGGAIASAASYLTGVHVPAEYVEYLLIAVAVLIFLIILFGGFALVVYVAGRFILTGLREFQAHKLNLAQIETVANPNKQAVTLVGGASR